MNANMDTVTAEERMAVLYGRLWACSSRPGRVIAEFDHLVGPYAPERRKALRLMFEVGRSMFPND